MSQMIESFMQPAAHPAAAARTIELEEPGAPAAGAAPLLRQAHLLHAVRVRLQVCVGEAEMSVGELLGARESEVLVLQRGLEQPVDLMLEGKVVARGQLVAVDGSFAVRISELPLPLKL
ncbi:FliM/FliN family flagellar motor switch protein [Ramlibacter alkalitolerans]|uniref:Flagellar motor switch protein FliN n=1 Tax=Ramlibacter alkalitolerans TaxID=2039631 RepID=A0ABS1JSX8_9BURK|nr:FliM/FliN family flagellar motor switch protein [Ramlibacter alkalitolerans]MBL0427384.1 FliM/FliN family flagellar motor switch protein [Ramlibacter alkalitolerans]